MGNEQVQHRLHVPVLYSLRNMGRSKGKDNIMGCADPNMPEIITIVIAPKCELKLVSSELLLPPALRNIRPNRMLRKAVTP